MFEIKRYDDGSPYAERHINASVLRVSITLVMPDNNWTVLVTCSNPELIEGKAFYSSIPLNVIDHLKKLEEERLNHELQKFLKSRT